jgi:phosphatidylglycerophosphate synthase
MDADETRRPIRARSSPLVQRVAAWLAHTRISANQLSTASILFACAGTLCLLGLSRPVGAIACALAIQARLLCNLLDGMVAVEGGKRSPVGQLYNEFPDRIADSVLIVGLGYAIDWPALGWFGALAAALTAYVRVFGGSLGLPQDFRGPMAKQHRMAVMTAGCMVGAAEAMLTATSYALIAASIVIAIGSVATCVTRTLAIAAQLKRS